MDLDFSQTNDNPAAKKTLMLAPKKKFDPKSKFRL